MFRSNLDAFAQGAFAAIEQNTARRPGGVGDPRLTVQHFVERANTIRKNMQAVNPSNFGNFLGQLQQFHRDAKSFGYTVPDDLSVDSVKGQFGDHIPRQRPVPPGAVPSAGPNPGAAATSISSALTADTLNGAGSARQPVLPDGPFGSEEARANWLETQKKAEKALTSIKELRAAQTVGNQLETTMQTWMEAEAKAVRDVTGRDVTWTDAYADPQRFAGALAQIQAKAVRENVPDDVLDAAIVRMTTIHEKLKEGFDEEQARSEADAKERRLLNSALEYSIAGMLGAANVEDGVLEIDLAGEDLKTYNLLTARANELVEDGLTHDKIMYTIKMEFAGKRDADGDPIIPMRRIAELTDMPGHPLWPKLWQEAYEYLPPDVQVQVHRQPNGESELVTVSPDGSMKAYSHDDPELKELIRFANERGISLEAANRANEASTGEEPEPEKEGPEPFVTLPPGEESDDPTGLSGGREQRALFGKPQGSRFGDGQVLRPMGQRFVDRLWGGGQ